MRCRGNLNRFSNPSRAIWICGLLLGSLLTYAALAAEDVSLWPADAKDNWTGWLVREDKHLALLTVRGSPQDRGTAHGKLLKKETNLLVKAVRAFVAPYGEKCLAGAREMRQFLEPDVAAELDACAAAADVNADELLLAQLFGDVNRSLKFQSLCSAFAAFGPATAGGKLVVGRNLDYAGRGLEGLPILLQEIPGGSNQPFIMIGYAGIIAGWTAMNGQGLCVSNNTYFGGANSLHGLATCFMLRKIVEHAKTVEEGVEILEHTPRSCTTGMLLAGRNKAGQADARFAEFDAEKIVFVEPVNGTVLGTNSRQKLGVDDSGADPHCPRYQKLKQLLKSYEGLLSFDNRSQKTVDARDVYMSINLHCALLEPETQRIRVAIKEQASLPAAEGTFHTFKVERDSIKLLAE
jgi:hypothetical protein